MKGFAESERDGWEARAEGCARAIGLVTAQFVPMLSRRLKVRRGQRLMPGPVACGCRTA